MYPDKDANLNIKKAAAGRTDSQQAKLKNYVQENNSTKPDFNQITCKICGGGVHSGAICPQYKGLVHHEHCKKCDYFMPALWMCRYRMAKGVI